MDINRRNNIWIVVIQCFVWLCIIIFPGISTYFITQDIGSIPKIIFGSFKNMLPMMILYFLNYGLLIPKLLFVKERKSWFYIINLLIIIGRNLLFIFELTRKDAPEELIESFQNANINLSGAIIVLILIITIVYIIGITVAVGLRSIVRWNEQQIRLKEEEKQKTQAELTWLRNQINPHFLFNAMNNISSLTQVDPDQAQEEIGRLSDVLRYSLYDADKPEVPLDGEIEFMRQYIGLMTLRCNDLAKIRVNMEEPERPMKIAPLLFISLIENAFKHGINSRQESFIDISLHVEGNEIIFVCRNSLFEKSGEDRIGSGIGIENMKHRLEILYPHRHVFETGAKEGEYLAKLAIKVADE